MSIVINHGVDIHYEVHGDKSNPPVLFCNGYGPPMDYVVKFYMPSFLDRFCCASYDIRGVGKSGAPEEDSEFSILRLAQDGLAVMDELGWDTAHVWAVSMGAIFGAKLAAIAPERVRSLVLNGFDPGAPSIHQKKYAQTILNRFAYMREPAQKGLTPRESAEKMVSFYGAMDTPRAQEVIDYFTSYIAAQPKKLRDWSYIKSLFPGATDVDAYVADLPDDAEPTPESREALLDELGKIEAATLIVHGLDPLIHRDCPTYGFDHIKNAELRLSKASKHSFSLTPNVLEEEADWFAKREAAYQQ